jgi:hypothetical protein
MATKAIFIDVTNRKFENVSFNSFDEIYKIIGNDCDTFAAPIIFENNDAIFIDDEGFFHDVPGGFIMEGWSYPLVGNGLIIGGDDEGNSKDVTYTIEWCEENIDFVSKEKAQEWVEIAKSQPARIINLDDLL